MKSNIGFIYSALRTTNNLPKCGFLKLIKQLDQYEFYKERLILLQYKKEIVGLLSDSCCKVNFF